MAEDYYLSRKQTKYERIEDVILSDSFIRSLETLYKILIVLLCIMVTIVLYEGYQLLKLLQDSQEYGGDTICVEQLKEDIPIQYVMREYMDNLDASNFTQTNLNAGNAEGLKRTFELSTEEYVPTDEERQFAYLVAFAEAGTEDPMGQTLVINVAINNMKEQGYSNLIEEFTAIGRYSSVKDGQVYNCNKLVSINDVPQEVKEAVDTAFEYDYSEEMLRQQAENLGITNPKYWEGGALYFYNPKICSKEANTRRENIKVEIQYGRHVFYRYWDK